MVPGLIFLVQALVVVALPIAVLRLAGLRSLVPLVVVQIAIGIALGPSLLGRIAPELYSLFFNKEALLPLSGIASVAVLFFGFITGLHLEPRILGERGVPFLMVAVVSVAVPAMLGGAAGLWIAARYPSEVGADVGWVSFAAAVGICTSVTALPVLGAILHEMNLTGRRIGQLALGIAGFSDAALWIGLSLLLTSTAGHKAEGPGPLATALILPLYLGVMIWGVRPLIRHAVVKRMRNGEISEAGLAMVCAVAIASGLITEGLGLHYILGAFVAGVVMPSGLRHQLLDRLQAMTVGLLMPFFFMLTGLRTLIHFDSFAFVEILIASTLAAVIGKVGATTVAARVAGEPWPIALGLGTLLQTKGLMEVIVLTILSDAGIISTNVFSALIVMAVISTALAMPLTQLMLGRTTKAAAGPVGVTVGPRAPSRVI